MISLIRQLRSPNTHFVECCKDQEFPHDYRIRLMEEAADTIENLQSVCNEYLDLCPECGKYSLAVKYPIYKEFINGQGIVQDPPKLVERIICDVCDHEWRD